jgi:general secretion pathway protein G
MGDLPAHADAIEEERSSGFTLIEVLVTIALLAVLAMIAIPQYADYQERVRIQQAITDIKAIEAHVHHFFQDNRSYPPDLAAIGVGGRLDPWGRPYEYTDLSSAKGNGSARKRKNLSPLNTDFDLYSVGKDGQSQNSLLPPVSRDDVIRALDGRFVGLGKDFDP